ncbi:LytR/AlgR family response regulator transcription factor [Flavobacteriaceae bacterium M23B6Z8]
MKKVVIIDDEEAGRKLIREYLNAFPELILVGEANNGVDAVKLMNEFKPDLAFLDVQMPGMTGFEVLTHIEEVPQIIFSTAYDQYALKAFEVHAVDYLLKPYTLERFTKAVERLSSEKNMEGLLPLTQSLINEKPEYPTRILVQHAQKLVSVDTKDIIRIEAYGDYSKLITAEHTLLSNYGISTLEEKLDPAIFIRVHRSAMINMHKVEEVQKYAKSYDVVMQNKEVVRVSRGYMENLRKLMF